MTELADLRLKQNITNIGAVKACTNHSNGTPLAFKMASQ
jgi:hypothetical protein